MDIPAKNVRPPKSNYAIGPAAIFVVCALLFTVAPANAQYYLVQSVGIPSSLMDSVAAAQQNSEWCWAASIQMVLRRYGLSITQDEIVRRTFDAQNPFYPPPNQPGSFKDITKNLIGCHRDDRGKLYSVGGVVGMGPPPPLALIAGFRDSEPYPVVLALATGPNTGHAVVATAATYVDTPFGPNVLTVTIRDPWPYPDFPITHGKRVVGYPQILNSVTAYWQMGVDIKRSGVCP